MPTDALLVLQAATTQTASTNSTGVNLINGTPKRGLWARVIVTTASGTALSFIPNVAHSDDNTTYTDLAIGTAMTATGVQDIGFITDKPYVRFESTIAGTSPSVVFSVGLSDSSHRTE